MKQNVAIGISQEPNRILRAAAGKCVIPQDLQVGDCVRGIPPAGGSWSLTSSALSVTSSSRRLERRRSA
ncbi:hypothetical protein C0J52_23938 [Blattella germanica]|nr:hypothetical protein C0J52_23938 [Blattella germanica]